MLGRISRRAKSVKEQRLLDEAPEEFGLVVTLDDLGARMEFVPDKFHPQIHPHGHSPAKVQDLKVLGGGGSGVRVFKGTDPELGSLVMKHGSERDTKELFALATISRELRERMGMDIDENGQGESLRTVAAQDMLARIPLFKMIYISPKHLDAKPRDYWENFSRRLEGGFSTAASIVPAKEVDRTISRTRFSSFDLSSEKSYQTQSSEGGVAKKGILENYVIRLYRSVKENPVNISRKSTAVKILLGAETNVDRSRYALRYGAPSEGYNCLKSFVDELTALQKKRHWKFTLAQKTIGGKSPKTAASHLAAGRLHGELLDKLVEEYIVVIHNLQLLTRMDEREVIDVVREEHRKADKDRCMLAFEVSSETDAFVGFAFKKNWHPDTGRFFCLRRMGKAFRKSKLYLTPEEAIPARLLGILLSEGTKMDEVFVGGRRASTALEAHGYTFDSWRTLLHLAISLKSPAAQQRLWNCGLSDGGLHNMFLSADTMLYLFDMETGRGWENRFRIVEDEDGPTKVALTDKTKELIPKAYSAFKVTMHRLVDEFFLKDERQAVRKLLVNYCTLQLLSDAAFCLERWKIKGGGRSRKTNHNKRIEEWLWRSIWDVYIASDLNSNKRLKLLGV